MEVSSQKQLLVIRDEEEKKNDFIKDTNLDLLKDKSERVLRAERYKQQRDVCGEEDRPEDHDKAGKGKSRFVATGSVIKVRQVSRHSVFIDLELSKDCETPRRLAEIQVLLKSREKGGEMHTDNVKWLSKDVHLGDLVIKIG